MASRMVARSTMHGTPVKSCMITRAGVNWISLSGSASGYVLRRPRSLRLTSLTYQLPKRFSAIPIMVLITFLIGAIIAQQGFFRFRKFGANSYVVDMV